NHNHLLGNVKGVDGIKTGYTEASGYNLTSSVRRDEKHIVAVVLGGTSNGARDARMRQLIEEHIIRAALVRTVPVVAEINDGTDEESPPVLAVAPAASKPDAMGEGDAGAAEGKAEAVPLPRPRVLAATAEEMVQNRRRTPNRARVRRGSRPKPRHRARLRPSTR